MLAANSLMLLSLCFGGKLLTVYCNMAERLALLLLKPYGAAVVEDPAVLCRWGRCITGGRLVVPLEMVSP